MTWLWGIVAPARGRRDWLFVGFVGLSVAVLGFGGVKKLRYQRAMTTFAWCAADADAGCAAAALETLRSVDAGNTRTKLAQAQLRVIEGETDTAAVALRPFAPAAARAPSVEMMPVDGRFRGYVAEPPPIPVGAIDTELLAKAEPGVRADVLLLVGDIEALRGDSKRAQARWTEAAGIVDDGLVAPRRRRLAAKADGAEAKLSSELEDLRSEFNKLFELARSGSDGETYAATALRTRVRSASPALASQKLALAVDAADRCNRMVRARRLSVNAPSEGSWRQPDPPIAPSESEMSKHPWVRENYARQQQQYYQNLARWQAQEGDKTRARAFAENELAQSANNTIAEAQSQLKEALNLMSASSASASNATTALP